MQTVRVIETDFGCYPAPAEMDELWSGCKLRKDRLPDRRTVHGRRFYELERAFMDAKRQEWLAA